ncbi:hypothetical protein PHLCEN_2v10496 [Hermanssonia centrifuga]|uniref:Major facilitator superfamily (MFS) profile domain-containing protein n=1 Tax=Hermanssonia centrifuga TaxID=98765 RepID=A0A2R6NMG9_9APHY|nr:hypothetical protein PHLCEN_2v10496 [Hermanssonia centrifuga]
MSSTGDAESNGMRTSSDSITKPVLDEKTGVEVSSLDGGSSVDYKTRFPHVDEKKVLRKIDLRVVPFVFIINFFTFLDRVNISNATLFGLKQDLKLQGNQYNTALLIYFVPYILLDIPSNVLMKRFKPHVWLTICMFGFGFVTIMEGLTKNFGGLLATRFFLGVFECAVFPGCLYLISMWYKRAEAQTRFTFFFSSNSLAGSFAGLLGYAIGHMDGMRGYRGWRWVFILEGTLSCVLAFVMFFLVSDFPEEASWLSEDEKAFVKARLQEDVGQSGRNEPVRLTHFVKLFKDYKSYLGAVMYFGLIVPAYSFAYFSPTIIQGLGHTAITTQLLSIPPYFAAFVFGMIISAISDRLHHRFAFTMLGICIAIVGFSILFSVHNHTNVEYGALFLAAIGTYTAMPLALCWYSMNVQGHAQRSVAGAFQIGFGNVGGIIASYAFLAKDAPKYLPGYSICISFACLSGLACCLYFLAITLQSKRRNVEDGETSSDGSTSDFKFEYIS